MNEREQIKLCVLAACHNRKAKTLQFLQSLVNQPAYYKYTIDIYLLDDGSADGTATSVKEKYPNVNIVAGTGNLYWSRSMRIIWEYAIKQKNYDLFLLSNDDVTFFDNSLEKLLLQYKSASSHPAVLIGSTLDPQTNKVSYGGNILSMHPFRLTKYFLIKPDETKPIKCRFGNGNILLVDKATIGKIGIFSHLYVQCFSDFDYTFTAHKAGINVLLAPGYYGYCVSQHRSLWLSSKSPLKERIKYLYSPKGLAFGELLRFVKKHFPFSYPTEFLKAWLKTLFPIIWDRFEKNEMPIESSNHT